MRSTPPKLFLGLGQLLRRDDGVGVRGAQVLGGLPLPEEVEVHDAGTAGSELTFVLEGRELVVVLDAIDAGAAPGTLFRTSPERVRANCDSGLSLHDFHLLDALEETRLLGTAPKHVVIYAIQPEDLSGGIGLSPVVEAALDRTLPLVLLELGLPAELLRAVEPAGTWLPGKELP